MSEFPVGTIPEPVSCGLTMPLSSVPFTLPETTAVGLPTLGFASEELFILPSFSTRDNLLLPGGGKTGECRQPGPQRSGIQGFGGPHWQVWWGLYRVGISRR